MKALIYVRRSKEGDERSVSLDVQEQRCIRHLKDLGVIGYDVLAHNGISGGDRERFVEIDARLKGVKFLVVYHLDRLARDVVAIEWLREWARRGIEVHVAGQGPVEVRTANGFLSTGIGFLVAEHYRAVVSEKTRDALARIREGGRQYSGKPPYGFTYLNGRLVPSRYERGVIDLVRALAPGLGISGTARELGRRGIKSRGGSLGLPKATVAKILRDYADMNVRDRLGPLNEPVVSSEERGRKHA